MSLGEAVTSLFGSPAGQAIIGLLALQLLNALLGISKAVANATFEWRYLDLFVRTSIAGRWIPISLVLVFGALTPDLAVLGLEVDVLTIAGLGAAIPVAAAELKSVIENLDFRGVDRVPEGAPAAGSITTRGAGADG